MRMWSFELFQGYQATVLLNISSFMWLKVGNFYCCCLSIFWDLKIFREFNISEGEGEGEVAQSCPTLCDPMDCSLPGSSIQGILQARILEWVAISFSRGSSQPRDQTQVSCIGGRRFNLWATREALFFKMFWHCLPYQKKFFLCFGIVIG